MEILQSHLADVPVCAFGSRVKGTARAYSDLDLAIMEVVSSKKISQLRRDFEESRLPFPVDVLEWPKISPSFQQAISADLVPLAIA